MKSLSPFQVVLLAVFAALAVGGVLVFALVVGGGGGTGIGPVSIWGPLDPGAFSVVLRQLAENDPRLSQVTYVQKDPMTYESDLTNALASGSGPDLFLLRQDYALKDAPKIVAVPYTFLPQSQFENTFVGAAAPYLSQDGVLGIPIVVDPLVMYWNRDMLATAGLAQPPRYWDEFSDAAQKLVKRTDAGAIEKAAAPMGEYANVNNAKDLVAILVLQAGGSITAQDSSGRLVPALSQRTGLSTSQAAESALRFYTEFADPSKVDYTWSRALPESRAAFASGDLALYFGYASEEPLLSRMNPNLNFTAALMPQVRTGKKSATAVHVYALATTKASRNPQGAITVASLLAATEASKALSVALGIPSARRDVLALPAPDGNDDLFNRSALIAQSWLDPDPDKTAVLFRGMIESITSGGARVTEAISRADQEMAQIIGQ